MNKKPHLATYHRRTLYTFPGDAPADLYPCVFCLRCVGSHYIKNRESSHAHEPDLKTNIDMCTISMVFNLNTCSITTCLKAP